MSCVTDKSEPECVNYTDCPHGFECIDGFCIDEGVNKPDEDKQTVDNNQPVDNNVTPDEKKDEEIEDVQDDNDDVDEVDEETEDVQDEEGDVDQVAEDTQDEEDDVDTVSDDSDQSEQSDEESDTSDESEVSDETADDETPDDYVPSCGNGIVDTGEDCDDGKNDNGDGCDLDCDIETGFKCSGAPSVCAQVIYNEVNLLTESATDIPVCSYIKVVFSQAMNDTSASTKVFLEKSGTKIALKKIKASGDFKEYTYYPAFNSGTIIDVDENYNLVVGQDIETSSGDKTSSDMSWSFSASTNDLYFETFEKNYSPWEMEAVWEIGTPNYPYDSISYPADRAITIGYDGSANTLGTIMDGFYNASVNGEEAKPLHPVYIPYSGASMSFYAHIDTEKGAIDWYDGVSVVIYECTAAGCFDNPGTSISVLENSDSSSSMTISGFTDLIGDYYVTSTSNHHIGLRGKEENDNTYQQFTVHFPSYFAGKWIFPVFKFYSDSLYQHPGIYVDNISIGY